MFVGWAMKVGLVALVGAADPTSAESAESATEVVRIKRDFGKPHFDLAIDAWTEGERLDRVRLLWVNTSEADRR
jgi:hypothetical protein